MYPFKDKRNRSLKKPALLVSIAALIIQRLMKHEAIRRTWSG